jgi:hypothetical protein
MLFNTATDYEKRLEKLLELAQIQIKKHVSMSATWIRS